MPQDAHGLDLTTSAAGAAAFDHALTGYLTQRADLATRFVALLEADPECLLGLVLRGYTLLGTFNRIALPAIDAVIATATRLAARATPREQAHAAALIAWRAGDLDRTLAIWEQILDQHPRDALAFRVHHFLAFWLGRPQTMATTVERIRPAWSPALPAFGTLLACRCFALEEAGHLIAAEPEGRRAIEIDRGDIWAAHAVAHVMEMQARREEGIAWLEALAPQWQGANNLAHHLWWHAALFRLEQGDHDTVLALYDTRIRNFASPLVQLLPDLYIDIQNAAALLFRLRLLGVDAADRWEELANRAEARIGDALSAFTQPHWMMALTAAGRMEAARRLLAALPEAADQAGPTLGPILRQAALPACAAVLAHAEGRYADALTVLRPALGGLYRLGGSHAQQDVLEQLFVDCARRAGAHADLRLALERFAGRRAVPPARWAGWRGAAAALPL